MSRIGKKPILIPKDVVAKVENGFIIIKGLKGEVSQKLNSQVDVEIEDNKILVKVKGQELKGNKALWGLYASLIKNMIVGVVKGFEKKLEIIGVGYKAALSGNKLILNIGFSHPIEFELPKDISASIDKNIITIAGFNKQLVGETAARIRKIKPPEPYKGTGIRYADEVVRKKAGKAAKTAAKV